MSSPVTEIVFFTSSEEYRSDPSILDKLVETLHKSPGAINTYHGPQVEDPNQAYAVVQWESLEHHKSLIESPAYSSDIIDNLKPAIGGPFEMVHVRFNKDPTKAFTAPVTEFVVFAVKPGQSKDEVASLLDVLTSQKTETVTLATWGPVVEKEDSFVMAIGWVSLEAHQEVSHSRPEELGKVVGTLTALTTAKVAHGKLIKY